ncbi:MAG: diadenylate cyclase CdaA [Candidatus Latescibacteria bacterium]|nr:diadenylate cyclase CdaA [Candidatus Latescibacterota bacterium]
MTLFKIGFLPVTVIDVLDILVVAFVFYELFILMRDTRAFQMLIGLLVLFVASILAQVLQMEGASWLFSTIQTVWVIAFVILFQPELRRILIHIGQSRIVRLFYRGSESRVIDEIVKGATMLSERGYGGLMAITRDTGIAAIIETGTKIRAEISAPLIATIFTPRSPLHDGAMIIHDEIVEAAKCILPLSENPDLDPTMGTRHRAALGLSEESDAVIVIVSEETQAISMAVGGILEQDITPKVLRERLGVLLGMKLVENVKRKT